MALVLNARQQEALDWILKQKNSKDVLMMKVVGGDTTLKVPIDLENLAVWLECYLRAKTPKPPEPTGRRFRGIENAQDTQEGCEANPTS